MRVLILSQWDWHGPARIPKALKAEGCEVAMICRKGDWAALTRYVDQRYLVDTTDEREILHRLDTAVREWQPQLILPGTDNMVSTLMKYRSSVETGVVELNPDLNHAVIQSLPPPKMDTMIGSKIGIIDTLGKAGVPVPPQRELATLSDADLFVQEHGYPVVLKPDVGWAGSGVYICNDEEELLRRLDQILVKEPRRYAIQKYMGSKGAVLEFVAKDGKMLAANTALRVKVNPDPTGPTSVAKVVNGKAMRQAGEIMAEALQYNGFCACQFTVQDDDCEEAHLIDVNPRMSPFVQIWRLIGTDLVQVLVRAWQGQRFVIEPPKVGLTMAFYPQEQMRDPNSPYLEGLRDRVEDDPELAASYEAMIAKRWAKVPT